ncbi:MAG TPA: LysR family transcriptional regulator [Zeimonas sp.]
MPPGDDPLRTELLWSRVHALASVATHGSFTNAARHLGVSKAAVSQRVSELERSVGAPLLQRTTRSVRLTHVGQQLVDETAECFARITASVAAARNLASQPRGVLRISAPVALGRQKVAPALEPFLRRYPDVRVELELSDQLVHLAQEGFDLAVRHTSSPPEQLVATKLAPTRTLLVASASYLRSRGEPSHPSELSEHDCLAYLRPGPAIWHFDGPAGARSRREPERVSVPVRGPFRANNSEVLRDAVLSGLGIAQVPDFSADAALRAGRLREVLPGWRPAGFFGESIYAIRPWGRGTPRALRLLVTHLQSEFGHSR